jgi:hypothetical protein
MRSHGAEENIQVQACSALSSMAKNGDLSKMIADAGGIDFAFTAMHNHVHNCNVQVHACMTNLFYKSMGRKELSSWYCLSSICYEDSWY